MTGYWAKQQQDAMPTCVFEPSDANDVAEVVKLVSNTQCPFSIKSGGHGAFAGVSSTQGGIIISMKAFDEIKVSEDASTVTLGTGLKWAQVYETLGKQSVTVAGGRYPSVGTGGLPLGGGMSFFSSRYGWTCDNILSYEVVIADGSIIQVSNDAYSDLFWALRGGGNNFGVVTKITMDVIPLQEQTIWGGNRIYERDHLPALIQASYNLGTAGVEKDSGVGQILNIISAQGQKIALATLTYDKPVENPPVMEEFLSIPAALDTMGVGTVTNISASLASLGDVGENAENKSRARGTATFKLSVDMMMQASDICMEEFEGVSDLEGVDTICVFQIITKSQLATSERHGTNAMGLHADDGPLYLLNVVIGWEDEADGARVQPIAKKVIDRATEYGQSQGVVLDFKYINYAGQFQDVIAGYGADNKAKLMSIAEKYDEDGVFQKLQPG